MKIKTFQMNNVSTCYIHKFKETCHVCSIGVIKQEFFLQTIVGENNGIIGPGYYAKRTRTLESSEKYCDHCKTVFKAEEISQELRGKIIESLKTSYDLVKGDTKTVYPLEVLLEYAAGKFPKNSQKRELLMQKLHKSLSPVIIPTGSNVQILYHELHESHDFLPVIADHFPHFKKYSSERFEKYLFCPNTQQDFYFIKYEGKHHIIKSKTLAENWDDLKKIKNYWPLNIGFKKTESNVIE